MHEGTWMGSWEFSIRQSEILNPKSEKGGERDCRNRYHDCGPPWGCGSKAQQIQEKSLKRIGYVESGGNPNRS